MNQEKERLARAWEQIQLYANVAWAPQIKNDFIQANQRLWSQYFTDEFNTRQPQVQTALTETHHKAHTNPRDNVSKEGAKGEQLELSDTCRAVKDVIPQSRLARFYGDFYYVEQSEKLYIPETGKMRPPIRPPTAATQGETVECWMLPEVDYWFHKLTCKDVNPDPSAVQRPEALYDSPILDGSPGPTVARVPPAPSHHLTKPGDAGAKDFPLLPTTAPGRGAPWWLRQLQQHFPELQPLAPFSLFSTAGTVQPRFPGTLQRVESKALYKPATSTEEEKTLFERISTGTVKDIWTFKPRLCKQTVADVPSKTQAFIKCPVFPLIPDLRPKLERALLSFKMNMKTIYASDDPYNMQNKLIATLTETRKIIQSRHKHKAPRIKNTAKSNPALNADVAEFFPSPSNSDGANISLFELFPKQGNLVNYPLPNQPMKLANSMINLSNRHENINYPSHTVSATSKMRIPDKSDNYRQDKLFSVNHQGLHNLECSQQNQSNSENKGGSFLTGWEHQTPNNQNNILFFPNQNINSNNPCLILNGLPDKAQMLKTIPVYQKPPETYMGRSSKNIISSSANNVAKQQAYHGPPGPNNNLIMLTNSKKNKTKDLKTRSLDNINFCAQNQQAISLFPPSQKMVTGPVPDHYQVTQGYKMLEQKGLKSQLPYMAPPVCTHTTGLQLTHNSQPAVSNSPTLKKQVDGQFTSSKNKNIKVNSRMFNLECSNSNKKHSPSYRRRKKEYKDRNAEVDNMTFMKKPIILLRKNNTSTTLLPTTLSGPKQPPENLSLSARDNPSSPESKSSYSIPPKSTHSASPPLLPVKAESSPISEVYSSTSMINMRTSPVPTVMPNHEEDPPLTSESPRRRREFTVKKRCASERPIKVSISQSRSQTPSLGRKTIPGPAAVEVPLAPSGRRLYSAVLSNASCEPTPNFNINYNVFPTVPPSSDTAKPPSECVDIPIKTVFSGTGNESIDSSVDVISNADAHFEKLEKEAIEQYKASDESINRKLEELERQAIEQYSGTSNSNTSCAGSVSKPDLSTEAKSSYDKRQQKARSVAQSTRTIDSVVIYSSASTSNKTGINPKKKPKNFKPQSTKPPNKQNKKKFSMSPKWISPRSEKGDFSKKKL